MENDDVAIRWFNLMVSICQKSEGEQKRLCKLIRADMQKIARGEHVLNKAFGESP